MGYWDQKTKREPFLPPAQPLLAPVQSYLRLLPEPLKHQMLAWVSAWIVRSGRNLRQLPHTP
jgi:hypothetical protein